MFTNTIAITNAIYQRDCCMLTNAIAIEYA